MIALSIIFRSIFWLILFKIFTNLQNISLFKYGISMISLTLTT